MEYRIFVGRFSCVRVPCSSVFATCSFVQQSRGNVQSSPVLLLLGATFNRHLSIPQQTAAAEEEEEANGEQESLSPSRPTSDVIYHPAGLSLRLAFCSVLCYVGCPSIAHCAAVVLTGDTIEATRYEDESVEPSSLCVTNFPHCLVDNLIVIRLLVGDMI